VTSSSGRRLIRDAYVHAYSSGLFNSSEWKAPLSRRYACKTKERRFVSPGGDARVSAGGGVWGAHTRINTRASAFANEGSGDGSAGVLHTFTHVEGLAAGKFGACARSRDASGASARD